MRFYLRKLSTKARLVPSNKVIWSHILVPHGGYSGPKRGEMGGGGSRDPDPKTEPPKKKLIKHQRGPAIIDVALLHSAMRLEHIAMRRGAGKPSRGIRFYFSRACRSPVTQKVSSLPKVAGLAVDSFWRRDYSGPSPSPDPEP